MRHTERGSSEHESLSRIREAASRMVTIVQQLLGFGRESEEAAGEVAVARLVSPAAADVRSQFGERGAALDITAASADTTIHADENRMRQSLVHLLRNALYASDGGRVRAGWRSTAKATLIFVDNTGAPVPPGDRERIFEPFYTTKPPGVGSGLRPSRAVRRCRRRHIVPRRDR